MKRIYLSVFVIIFSCNSTQNLDEELIDLCKAGRYNDLYEKMASLKESSTKAKYYEFRVFLDREVIAGYTEKVITVEEHIQSKENKSMYSLDEYKLYLITDSTDKIQAYRLVEPRLEKGVDGNWEKFEDILSKSDQLYPKEMQEDFNRLYGVNFDYNYLFQYEIYFGESCGQDGNPPEYRYYLEKAIVEKDTATINKWLFSPVAEKQLYAIEGILRLGNEGHSFDSATHSIIKEVSRKEGYAQTCAGCEYGDQQEIRKLVEIIKKRILQEL
ncbi:hypothetical protein R9C00_03175 [Flammeovirgaceae bacterium SG7u.111]|nr:hypothetical protein [Flammeovirgaceae bacterium SG7u.132]WPO36444.1 hypothetical protein R9C00_03175 [Flammeovirgaceae bacterium SG7u.111]